MSVLKTLSEYLIVLNILYHDKQRRSTICEQSKTISKRRTVRLEEMADLLDDLRQRHDPGHLHL